MPEREGKINAAGGFLRAITAQRSGAQGAFDAQPSLPVAQTLGALAALAPTDSEGTNVELLAPELGISHAVLVETLANLSELDLVTLLREGGEERARLTDLGTSVAVRQRERHDAH